ncbi:hypothetical protein [Curtobacterium citreum]|uniref:Helix-turn-helix protein n=1 Tax=Curtobacterium citreum TaxID=2036 RepID=A0ABT2HDM5_9MICO|nr:hypothetical protein [Curtobacterium citreum]MCS6521367.1 hypothetical protein [Curtobacterium citreum]TQJ28226.1 hypothetical protein FB462_2106 [Curtobacterium citreum]
MITDEQIGRAVSRLRGDRAQREVAAAMRELGWRWSQTTVWKVESGERPLRLAEAMDLEQVLGSELQVAADAEQAAIAVARAEFRRALAELQQAAARYEASRARLQSVAGTHEVLLGLSADEALQRRDDDGAVPTLFSEVELDGEHSTAP